MATTPAQGVTRQDPLRIAVEGVIGVGKTTLVRALAERLGAVRLSEDELGNPFLARFYKQPARWAFACQTFFLEARLRQFATRTPVGVPVVADHSLQKEPLFAAVNLEGEELALYRRLYDTLAPSCAFTPQIVVYLHASLAEVKRRIRNRGRREEGALDSAYLGRLIEAYEGWFDQIQNTTTRCLVVDADGVNIAADPHAVDRLIDACLSAPPGVSYCNPVS